MIINFDGCYYVTKEEIAENKRKEKENKRVKKAIEKPIVKKERVYTWDEIIDCINLGN